MLVKLPKIKLFGNLYGVSQVVTWTDRHGKANRQILQLSVVNMPRISTVHNMHISGISNFHLHFDMVYI